VLRNSNDLWTRSFRLYDVMMKILRMENYFRKVFFSPTFNQKFRIEHCRLSSQRHSAKNYAPQVAN
jgi:hypothetical protein